MWWIASLIAVMLLSPLGYERVRGWYWVRQEAIPPPFAVSIQPDPTFLEQSVQDFVNKRGPCAFLEEYYNLVGTKRTAEINAKNAVLARAFGLKVNEDMFPVYVVKKRIHNRLPISTISTDRRFLARLFADASRFPQLDEVQRLFLEWHFLSPPSYEFSLVKPNRQLVLGWNTFAEMAGVENFDIYAFGQVECTVILVESSCGDVNVSHYDLREPNRSQLCVVNDFLNGHPNSRIDVIGVYAGEVANSIHQAHPEISVGMHVKKKTDTVYSIHFKREQGRLSTYFNEKNISKDFLSSTQYLAYGRWFTMGRTNEMCPTKNDRYDLVAYEPVGVPSGS